MDNQRGRNLINRAIAWYEQMLDIARQRLVQLRSCHAPAYVIEHHQEMMAECMNAIDDLKSGQNLREHIDMFKVTKQVQDELCWIEERLSNISKKLAVAMFLSPDIRRRLELTRRNLLVRRDYLRNGGDPFDDEAREQTKDTEYPYELELIEDILEQKSREFEPYAIDENGNCPVPDDHPEKVRLEKEFDELDDLKNEMKDSWEHGEPFTEEQLEKLFGYMTKFPTNDFVEGEEKEEEERKEINHKLGIDSVKFGGIDSDDYKKEQERLGEANEDDDDYDIPDDYGQDEPCL